VGSPLLLSFHLLFPKFRKAALLFVEGLTINILGCDYTFDFPLG